MLLVCHGQSYFWWGGGMVMAWNGVGRSSRSCGITVAEGCLASLPISLLSSADSCRTPSHLPWPCLLRHVAKLARQLLKLQ